MTSKTTSRLLTLRPLSFLSLKKPSTCSFHTTTLNHSKQEEETPIVDQSPASPFSLLSIPKQQQPKRNTNDRLPLLKVGDRKVGGHFEGETYYRDAVTGAKVVVRGWDKYHHLRKKPAPEEDKYGAPDELKYMTPNFNATHKKLRFIGNQITGKPIDEAIRQLNFSSKLSAETIVAYLKQARQIGVEVRKWNPEHMFVQQAFTGKGPKFQKEVRIHARGKFGIMHHPTAHMRFVIKENIKEADYGLGIKPPKLRGQKVTRKVWAPLTDDVPIRNKDAVMFYNW